MPITLRELTERLETEVLVADGAMGTVLQSRAPDVNFPYDRASLAHPELVESRVFGFLQRLAGGLHPLHA